jgi:hypothetical protein
MFRRVAGRPVLPDTDPAAQRRRMMSRCQRMIVSGVTSSRSHETTRDQEEDEPQAHDR